jgi:hypothetical protein
MAESSVRFAKPCSPKTTERWHERVAGIGLSGTSTTDDSAIRDEMSVVGRDLTHIFRFGEDAERPYRV